MHSQYKYKICRLLRAIVSLMLFCCLNYNVRANNDLAQSLVEKIKNSSNIYYYGQGSGVTHDDADREALANLARSVNAKIYSNYSEKLSDGAEGDVEEMHSSTTISSVAFLGPTEEIVLSEEPNCVVFRYVRKTDVQEQFVYLADRVKEYAAEGIKQEQKAAVASALRYFNWAYAIARMHPEAIKIDVGGESVTAKVWLQSHISDILSSIHVSLQDVIEQPGELDPYLVTLKFTYGGYPVVDLDFSYNNGLKKIENMHATNGEATLAFPSLPKNFDLQYRYKYEEEGMNMDEDLKSIFPVKPTPTFSQSNHEVKCSGTITKKFKIGKDVAEGVTDKKGVAVVSPMVAPPRKQTTDRQAMDTTEAMPMIDVVQMVKAAIRSGDYSSVKNSFTPEGYALFLKMMTAVNENNHRKGRVILSQGLNTPVTIEQSGNFIVAKDIPVQLQYASGHKVNERIVLRFNVENKIQSVAFALSQRAEQDIFRDNSWGLDVRYAIKQFMEDYQTAFALKREDYIRSIFSDGAIIITGKRITPQQSASRRLDNGVDGLSNGGFEYTSYTKDSYMKKLSNDFKFKKYIQIKFEENEIQSVACMFNNIYWIQLKQFYNSSNYSDIGYLALMLDMRGENPQIRVRTWLPEKFDIELLKRHYPVE